MSVSQIIYQIAKVIRDMHTSREKKIENLQNLAMTCWQEVIPECKNPETFQNLESTEIQQRWAEVRDEVEKYATKSQILYVLIVKSENMFTVRQGTSTPPPLARAFLLGCFP